jgi:hypothetical protein
LEAQGFAGTGNFNSRRCRPAIRINLRVEKLARKFDGCSRRYPAILVRIAASGA